MVEVVVIGSDPPCIRCSRVVQLVNEGAEEIGLSVRVKSLSFQSPEAQGLATGWQRELGTARDVARKGSADVDWGLVASLMKKEYSPDLDKELRPCLELADKIQILMTPVLIVNGRLKHHGSVPESELIRTWLREAAGEG
jgi:protein-disulfide isomerase